jgi:hypothetical protein
MICRRAVHKRATPRGAAPAATPPDARTGNAEAAFAASQGIATLQVELGPKQLQLLRELIPNAAAFGVLADPVFPSTPSIIADLQRAARTLGLQLIVVNAKTDCDY